MDDVERAAQIYRELGQSFLDLASRMNEKMVAEIRDGSALVFWQAEIALAFGKLDSAEEVE